MPRVGFQVSSAPPLTGAGIALRVALWLALSWVSFPPAVALLVGAVLPVASGVMPTPDVGGLVLVGVAAGFLAGVSCAVLYPALLWLASANRRLAGGRISRARLLLTTLALSAGAVTLTMSLISREVASAAVIDVALALVPLVVVAWPCLAWPPLAFPVLLPGVPAAGQPSAIR